MERTDVSVAEGKVTAEGFESKPEWLKARQLGIGASEVPSLFSREIAECGEPMPFLTEFELWSRKAGLLADEVQETSRMRLGSRFEGAIADEFALVTGLAVLLPSAAPLTIFRNTSAPNLFATPDRFFDDEQKRRGVLEVKLTREKWDEVPLRVQIQVQTQMAVTALGLGKVAACFGSEEVLPFDVPYDSELVGMIVERATLFWRRVEAREPPEVVAADRDVVKKLYPRHSSGKVVVLAPDMESVYSEWVESRRAKKVQEECEGEMAAKLQLALGDGEIGELPSGRRFSWKTEKRPAYTVAAGERRVLRELKSKEVKQP